MVEEARRGELTRVWESHLLGREKPYAQIERLANLDQLPEPTGYMVYAFPYKIEGASAGFARVVAIAER
jgi:kynurenine formamidase